MQCRSWSPRWLRASRPSTGSPAPLWHNCWVKLSLFYQLPCAEDQSDAARYRETMEQIQHGDALGFDCAWLAELHFFKPFSILSSPLILAAAVAQTTTRIRLGIAVNLLPLTHPVRSAEDGATVDILSQGRLEFGVGRGAVPLHFAGFNASREESRERFEESLEIIQKAWTQERFSYDGKFYQVPETSVVPKPLQRPHPPIRVAANSAETIAFAGEAHHPIFVASVTNPLPRLYEQIDRYRNAWASNTATAGPAGPDVSTMFFVHPGESLEQVRADTEVSLKNYFQSVSGMVGAVVDSEIGHESYRHLEEVKKYTENITFQTMSEKMGVFGSAEDCIQRITEIHKHAGMKELICWFNPGGRIPHEKVLASMARFASDVAPAVREL